MSRIYPAIAHEIASLPFDDEEFDDVIVASGAAMELYGIRRAEDIDLIIPMPLQKRLQKRQPGQWERKRKTMQREVDGANFELRWLADAPANPDVLPRFDIWPHWYDPGRDLGDRIIEHEDVKKHTVKHELGFRAMELDYLYFLKQRFGRAKDLADVALMDALREQI